MDQRRVSSLHGARRNIFLAEHQHDAFRVWPHNTRKLWFFANGETVVTLARDFRFGTYSTFWADEDIFCIFGQELINAFLADPPRLLDQPVRRRI